MNANCKPRDLMFFRTELYLLWILCKKFKTRSIEMLSKSELQTLENAERRLKGFLLEIEQFKKEGGKGNLTFEMLSKRISKMLVL